MTAVRNVYRVARSILFAAILTVGAIIVLLYVALSVPPVQKMIRNEAEKQLTQLFKAPVTIGDVSIMPFNELQLNDVEIRTPDNQKCLSVKNLGAGVAFWKLLISQKIEITYAEIIGLDAGITQAKEGAPLNIQFIIDAFKPKQQKKEPTRFDLVLHNIVIRKSNVRFDRLWQPVKAQNVLDPNHLKISNLRADISMPRLKNDDYVVNLRRLSFREKSGLYVDGLSFFASVTPQEIELRNFRLDLTDGKVRINNQKLPISGFKNIVNDLRKADLDVVVNIDNLHPGELAFLLPSLDQISDKYDIDVHVDGSVNRFRVENLSVTDNNGNVDINFRGNVSGLATPKALELIADDLEVEADGGYVAQLLDAVGVNTGQASEILSKAGQILVKGDGGVSLARSGGVFRGLVSTDQGLINLDVNGNLHDKTINGKFKIDTEGFDLGSLMATQPVGQVKARAEGEIGLTLNDLLRSNGDVKVEAPSVFVNGQELTDIFVTLQKQGKQTDLQAQVSGLAANGEVMASCTLDGPASTWDVTGNDLRLDCNAFGILPKQAAVFQVASLDVKATGNNEDNVTGFARISDINYTPAKGNTLVLSYLNLDVSNINEIRRIDMASDVMDGTVQGQFAFKDLPVVATDMLSRALPAYIKAPARQSVNANSLNYDLTVKSDAKIYEALNLKVRPGVPARLYGTIDNDRMNVNVSAPYLIQGESKLIKNVSVTAESTVANGLTVKVGADYPIKTQYVHLDVDGHALNDRVAGLLVWKGESGKENGTIDLGLNIVSNEQGKKDLDIAINPSEIVINNETWRMSPATVRFSDKRLTVDNLSLNHGDQYLTIQGAASDSPDDELVANLRDIDLSYIFNTLNINYVTFGGRATGQAVASNLFSGAPLAETRGLHVKNFSYNGADVGDADLLGYWDNTSKAVGIGADIQGGTKDVYTKVDGKIFVTQDSLRINFDAHKINLALIQPFLSNVMEKVEGAGSADLTLYGNFKRIRLTGKAFADTAAIKIGYTNVTYYGSDSVLFDEDKIVIPGFRIRDRYGNGGVLAGTVSHEYFHDAKIDLNLKDIRRMLCYDMTSASGQAWWGRIFASGSGRISGYPGYTLVSFDATTEPNSNFTFSLGKTQTAEEYDFLTFTDSHKKVETEITEQEEFETKFKKPAQEEEEAGIFEMDLSVALTPSLKMNVIMDPAAGDKITATGSGAMRLNYNTFNDNVELFGRYAINDGSYRFTFQDIIIRDFKIKEGSSISFNGDAMKGILDLTAGYRVNTNLSDLDKSFATDRDLNRSSVPVEALLKVTGELQHPELAFDIALPTVTGDVERKVRSIVSSEEMMQQQVLYLLALNRFYTPQFSGTSDGELVSMASSTLSSQISNVVSQLTDKVSLNPSFKSGRNDFSDMEVDLALSSQLFDNRLIINGNLGYRDRSVSQTTFIGDFDLEYLLTKDGKLRLKAYNHFNDAYYYLKSALTTQGVGIIFRKDFDDAFKFLRKKKKKNGLKTDSVR